MMFEVFEESFSKDATLSIGNAGRAEDFEMSDCSNLLDRFGGDSFENGLYRVIRTSDVGEWKSRVAVAFPEFGERTTSFGFDWLGRVFALDPKRSEGGQPGVVMFEPGTGEALEISCNIGSFHDEELIKHGDAALASGFYKRWLADGGGVPQFGQCVGYKKPLFLGGADELGNLDISDIDVYWHLLGQLILKVKGLPPGTPIRVGLEPKRAM